MHAVFLPLSMMNFSSTSPVSTFGIRVDLLEAQIWVSFLRKHQCDVLHMQLVLFSVLFDRGQQMRLPKAGLSLPGWPEAASLFSSSSFLLVLIPHSSFSTGILVSSPRVAFLLLILVFQVRHETEEWG